MLYAGFTLVVHSVIPSQLLMFHVKHCWIERPCSTWNILCLIQYHHAGVSNVVSKYNFHTHLT